MLFKAKTKKQKKSKQTVVTVKNLHKNFRLPTQKISSIKSVFTDIGSFRKQSYDVQHALKDVSFEVREGEFFGIVGRNGSGKSTLLKILAGIYHPTKGEVSTKGKVVPFIELGVGFNPELTGRENVYLNGAMLGFNNKEIDAKYASIVDFAELEKFMGQKLKNYSSGMQVRLAFSVATILAESDILLLDEVLAVGDADFQRKCFDYFKNLKKQKKTVVFVSHDMGAIREYCDRVALIDDSRIVKIGKPNDIATMYFMMFTQDKGDGEKQSTKRWGDKKIVTTKVSVKVEKDFVHISTVAKVNEDMDSGNFGFTIRNASGDSVLGTNNKIKNKRIGPLKKGGRVNVDWKIPNIFSDGTYFVDPAVISENHVDVHDWWTDAKRFKVFNEQNTPHIVSPNIGIKYKIEGPGNGRK